jgi:hypothetical protein
MKLFKPQAAKRSFLPTEVELALLKLNMTHFRQSDLSRYRRCPFHYYAVHNATEQRYDSLHAFLGSTFHKAIYHISDTDLHGDEPEYWVHLMRLVKDEHSDQVLPSHNEMDIAKSFIKDYDMANLVSKVHGVLVNKGYIISAQELNLQYRAGKILFTGTLDMLVVDRKGRVGILDVKTSGMWDKIIRNAAVKGQDADIESVSYHTQLSHYKWLLLKAKNINAEFQGILYPVNGIPLTRKSGNKLAGQDRGQILVVANCEQLDYEQQLTGWLRSIASNNFYKAFPEIYGKSDCHKCSVFFSCRGKDAAVATTPTSIEESDL